MANIKKFDDFLNEGTDMGESTKILKELWKKHLGAFMKEAIKLEKDGKILPHFLYDKFLCSIFTDVPAAYRPALEAYEKEEREKKTKK